MIDLGQANVSNSVARVCGLAEAAGAPPDVVERVYRAMIDGFIALELQTHGQRRAGR
jgi:isochorismate pyruvate lyase